MAAELWESPRDGDEPAHYNRTIDEYTDAVFRTDSERTSFCDSFSELVMSNKTSASFADLGFDDWTPRLSPHEECALKQVTRSRTPEIKLALEPAVVYVPPVNKRPPSASSTSSSTNEETVADDEGNTPWDKTRRFLRKAKKKIRPQSGNHDHHQQQQPHLSTATVVSVRPSSMMIEVARRRSNDRQRAKKKGTRLVKQHRTPSDVARALHQNEVNASSLRSSGTGATVKCVNPLSVLTSSHKMRVLSEARQQPPTAPSSSLPPPLLYPLSSSSSGSATLLSSAFSSWHTTAAASSSSTPPSPVASPRSTGNASAPTIAVPLSSPRGRHLHSPQSGSVASTAAAPNTTTPSTTTTTTIIATTSVTLAAASGTGTNLSSSGSEAVPSPNPLYRKFVPAGGTYEAAGQVQATRSGSAQSGAVPLSPRGKIAPSERAASSLGSLTRILDRKHAKSKKKSKRKTSVSVRRSYSVDRAAREWRSVDDS